MENTLQFFVFTGCIYYLYVLSETLDLISKFGDIMKMADVYFLLNTHLAQFFKIYYFHKNYHRIRRLINDFERDIFKPKNAAQRKILNWSMTRARNDSQILLGMAVVTCTLWAIFPFIEKKADDQIRLPLGGWYPFDHTVSPNFQIAFFYQIFGATLNALSNIALDTTATGIFVLICGQIDMLNNSLEIMKHTATKSLMAKKKSIKDVIDISITHENESESYTTEELEEGIKKVFKKCVIHHEEIIRYANDIEDMFNMCFLAQFAASIIIICLTMFKLSLASSVLSIEFVSLILYQACIVMELLLYCWHGNEMTLKSIALSDAVYNSEWYEFSPKFSRDIMLLMVRTKRPIKMTAGKFAFLSISTFTAILRCSWSYFAVLNSMKVGEEEE